MWSKSTPVCKHHLACFWPMLPRESGSDLASLLVRHTSTQVYTSTSPPSSLRTDTGPDSLVHFSFQHLLPHLVKDEAEAFRVSGLQNGAAGRQEQLCTLRVHLLQVVLDQPCLAALVIKPQASRLVVVLNLSMKCVHLGFIRERAL